MKKIIFFFLLSASYGAFSQVSTCFNDDFSDMSEFQSQSVLQNSNAISYGDVIFSEIMAKPGSGAPEYVEFYHAGSQSFQLKDFLYYYGDKSYKLPEGQIDPGDYFVLCKTTVTNSFPEGIKVFGVTSFPTIADGGKLLQFATADEELISWFEYADSMYGDADKKSSGGYSLECLDLLNKSNTAQNWTASDIAGGTPGKSNSVQKANPDKEIPTVKGLENSGEKTIRITFSKPMDRETLLNRDSYSIDNPDFQILNIQTDYPKGMYVDLELNDYPESGTMIRLDMSGVRDLSSYCLEEDRYQMLGEGHQALANELVINEILFNPPTGGNEYVEIYNRSDKAFDLRFLSITSRKPSDGSFNKAWPLSSMPLLIEPGEYWVVTKSMDLVCEYFNCLEGVLFSEPGGMPSLANTSGCAVLLNNKTGEIVDEFSYNEKMHASGISNKKGVSLERIDFNKPSGDGANWHSAAATAGYGTPGYKNSQYLTTDVNNPEHFQEPISIAYPSNESGSYTIYYKLEAPGYRCNIYVFDSMGRKVSQISNNQLLGIEGDFLWNGKGNSGIYIVFVEIYGSDGKVNKFRKPVVVR